MRTFYQYSFFIALLIIVRIGFSQDIQFSQFYQAQLYQNPAFAGSLHEARLSSHNRIQWPSIDAKYVTNYLSYDTYLRKYRSGFGGYLIYDRQSRGNVQSYELAGQYSYELHLTNFISFRYGLQVGLGSKTLDYLQINFPEQYDDFQGLVGANPFQNNPRKVYADISSGGVLYTTNWWLGLSAHHINTPNQTFLNLKAPLPTKFALTAGYRFVLRQNIAGTAHEEELPNQISITPTFHLKSQGRSDQFDVGLYGQYYQGIVGVWYRGIPIKTMGNFQNNESIVALVGYRFYNLSLTYSYDFIISSLTRANPFGAHELNLTYFFSTKRFTKPTKKVPCPQYYRY